jgi:uncharacterized protein
MKTKLLVSLLLTVTTVSMHAVPNVWINEIHYDNVGTDSGEFVEIAGVAGTDLTGFSIVLYNGANGLTYDTDSLSGSIPNQQNGFGTVSISYPVDGMQNGAPDAIALVDSSSAVIQFLSYEGAFMALNGPANTMTSVNIGVSESSATAVGASLGLTGTGTAYSDFTWSVIDNDTPGAINAGQSFPAPAVPDTGATFILLSLPLLGLIAFRRFAIRTA